MLNSFEKALLVSNQSSFSESRTSLCFDDKIANAPDVWKKMRCAFNIYFIMGHMFQKVEKNSGFYFTMKPSSTNPLKLKLMYLQRPNRNSTKEAKMIHKRFILFSRRTPKARQMSYEDNFFYTASPFLKSKTGYIKKYINAIGRQDGVTMV